MRNVSVNSVVLFLLFSFVLYSCENINENISSFHNISIRTYMQEAPFEERVYSYSYDDVLLLILENAGIVYIIETESSTQYDLGLRNIHVLDVDRKFITLSQQSILEETGVLLYQGVGVWDVLSGELYICGINPCGRGVDFSGEYAVRGAMFLPSWNMFVDYTDIGINRWEIDKLASTSSMINPIHGDKEWEIISQIAIEKDDAMVVAYESGKIEYGRFTGGIINGRTIAAANYNTPHYFSDLIIHEAGKWFSVIRNDVFEIYATNGTTKNALVLQYPKNNIGSYEFLGDKDYFCFVENNQLKIISLPDAEIEYTQEFDEEIIALESNGDGTMLYIIFQSGRIDLATIEYE